MEIMCLCSYIHYVYYKEQEQLITLRIAKIARISLDILLISYGDFRNVSYSFALSSPTRTEKVIGIC